MFLSRNKKNIDTFLVEKSALSRAMIDSDRKMDRQRTRRMTDTWKNTVALAYPYHKGK